MSSRKQHAVDEVLDTVTNTHSPLAPISETPRMSRFLVSLGIGRLALMLSMTACLLMAAGCGNGPSPVPTADDGVPAPSAEPAADTVIIDGLMWTVEDNGQDIDWNNATAYCEDLTLDGFSDWGLASLAQLEALYDPGESYIPPDGTEPIHIKNPIQLTTYYVWSSERSGTGSAWYFFFARGYRNSLQVNNPSNGRVLCVRVP